MEVQKLRTNDIWSKQSQYALGGANIAGEGRTKALEFARVGQGEAARQARHPLGEKERESRTRRR